MCLDRVAQPALRSRRQARGVLRWGGGRGFTIPSRRLRQTLREPWDSSAGSPDLRAAGSPLPWSSRAELPAPSGSGLGEGINILLPGTQMGTWAPRLLASPRGRESRSDRPLRAG